MVALAPDVVLAAGTPSVAALQQSSRSIPIVFTAVTDPVGAGFVDSVAQPGGNTTGFMLSEYVGHFFCARLFIGLCPHHGTFRT
jgi:putative tryptophan/tyrosine transport system substrate-binding protein